MRIIFTLFFLTILISLPGLSLADEFNMGAIRRVDNDLSAIAHPRRDANDELCALIKVRTDIDGLNFTSGMGVAGNIRKKEGDYWVYVSPGERRLKLFRGGFSSKEIYFSEHIEAGTVYILEVQRKGTILPHTGKGNISINSNPADALIRIDGLPDIQQHTPFTFEGYKTGNYRFIITKDRYIPIDTVLIISKDTAAHHHFYLKPKWGTLEIHATPEGSGIFIDQEFYGNDLVVLSNLRNALDAGTYTVEVQKDHYYPKVSVIEVISDQNNRYDIKLEPITGSADIRTKPSGARILIDGTDYGYSPLKIDRLLESSHSLILQKEGYAEHQETLIIEENIVQTIAVSLQKSLSVFVSSKPDGATIILNGQKVGITPEYLDIQVGSNHLELQKPDYENLEEDIFVDHNTSSFHYDLVSVQRKVFFKGKPKEASVSIDGKNAGTAPFTTDLRDGRYEVSFSKRNHKTLNKKIRINGDDKTINYRLAPQGFLIVGALFSKEKIGGEFGLSFGNFFLSAGGIGLPEYKFSQILSNTEVNPSYYTGLQTSSAEGFITTQHRSDGIGDAWFGKMGFRFTRPIGFVIAAGIGVRAFKEYAEVFYAGQTYTSDYGYPDINEGTYFATSSEKKYIYSLIAGAVLPIRFGKSGGIYLSADYWFNTEDGPCWVFGGGLTWFIGDS